MMKTNGLMIFMGACLLACADVPLDVPASAEAATATRAAPPTAVEDVNVKDVRSMLQVRHSKDLPRRKAIRAVPGAEQALRDIVQNDDAAVMRTRAAKLLGHFDTSEAFLVTVLSDATQLESVRAGAIRGLATMGLEHRKVARDAVFEQLASTSPRLGLEAVEVLSKVPAFQAELDERSADTRLSPVVKSRLMAR